MGEASILPVHIVAVDDTTATVRIGEATVALPRRGLGIGRADLAVRPHAVRLVPGDQTGLLRGRIGRTVDRGDHMEYDVMVDDFPNPVFVVDSNVANPPPAGAAVGIELVTTGLSLVPAAP